MINKKYIFLAGVLIFAIVVVLVAPMFAQTAGLAMGIVSVAPVFAAQTGEATLTASDFAHGGLGMAWGNGRMERANPGIFGTVAGINGNIITIDSKLKNNSSTTVYAVNAGNATIMKNGVSSSISNIAVGDNLLIQGSVSGNTITATLIRDNIAQRPGISGTVSAINENTITVTDRKNVVYSVDASGASIDKNGTSSSISNIAIGDKVMVFGTVNGNSVTATSIRDILNGGGRRGPGSNDTFNIQGNGQPLVSGTITSINGETINITNKSNVSYVIDASNAKFLKGNSSSTISGFAVGDSVVVQGTVNGNSISASSIIGVNNQNGGSMPQDNGKSPVKNVGRGFFGGIFGFFQRIFGF